MIVRHKQYLSRDKANEVIERHKEYLHIRDKGRVKKIYKHTFKAETKRIRVIERHKHYLSGDKENEGDRET